MIPGKLYAIGVGPGASDLITVRGARIIADLDVLYAPTGKKGVQSLAHTIIEEYLSAKTEVRTYHFLMQADPADKAAVWDEVAQALEEEVAKGRKVGFITLGDPMLFSTWVFLLERIGHQPWLEIVPGVTSFAAIASRSAMPLAMGTQTMAVVSCTAPQDELEHMLCNHDCVVLMKVYGCLEKVRTLLHRLDLLEHALMMADATLPNEQCWRQLDKLESELKLPYFSTILVNKNWNTRS